MIVPDWYNIIWDYTKKFCKNNFSNEKVRIPDAILPSCGFKVMCNEIELLRFSEMAKNIQLLDPF